MIMYIYNYIPLYIVYVYIYIYMYYIVLDAQPVVGHLTHVHGWECHALGVKI